MNIFISIADHLMYTSINKYLLLRSASSVHAMQLSFNTIPALGHICSCENPVRIACKTSKLLQVLRVILNMNVIKEDDNHQPESTISN